MANADHLRKLQQSIDDWNSWRGREPFTRPNLGGANLRGMDLRGVDFSKADLRRANLGGANLSEADLSGASLRGASLCGVNLWGTNLWGADLVGVDLSKVDLTSADLSGRDLSEVNLSGADLSGRDLRETNLHRANLSGANLSNADFDGAKFSEVDFNGVDLSGADLSGADLAGMSLSKVNLRGTRLREAKLYGADLRDTDCGGADLSGADLSEANLSGVDLSETDLREANLIDAQLDGANLTGSKLWEIQHGGWSVKDVICPHAFWDRGGTKPTNYGDGEFERIFAEKPRIILHYPGGMLPIDLLSLPLIIERLEADHPGSMLQIRSVQNDAGGASVTIVVEDLENRGAEAFGQELVRLETELKSVVGERDFLRQCLVPVLPELYARVAEALSQPRQQVHIYGSSAPIEIGSSTMSRDTYNLQGQAGAVGPGAHAHDNTFQQIQGADLPKLAEELGRLRTAMKSNATGTRDEDKAIGVVADAEEAAAKGDGPVVLQHLKSAGRWTLKVAEEIGVPVAIEALKRAM